MKPTLHWEALPRSPIGKGTIDCGAHVVIQYTARNRRVADDPTSCDVNVPKYDSESFAWPFVSKRTYVLRTLPVEPYHTLLSLRPSQKHAEVPEDLIFPMSIRAAVCFCLWPNEYDLPRKMSNSSIARWTRENSTF